MTESGVRSVAGRLGTTLAASPAAQAVGALVTVLLALSLVYWATSLVGVTAATDSTLTTIETVGIPLVLAWASVVTVLLGRWLWETSLPDDVGGEGWARVRRLVWVEWVTQGVRWLVLGGLLNLGLILPVTWVQWASLAFGVETTVGSVDMALASPFVVGAVALLVWAARGFRQGLAEA